VDGVVRFAYLFFARHRQDKEWFEVIAETMKGHVVVCGAGRVGYRVVAQLRALGRDVVVVEKREEAAFVAVLRDEQVPLLIDDIRSQQCLPRTNVKTAAAIVCATDDDLANLNIALDARKVNPNIRVVIRLFDDDLVAKVRDTFKAEDPRIIHSFRIGTHLMVVSVFEAREKLPGMTLAEVRDRFGGLALAMRRHGGGEERLHPPGSTLIEPGDLLTLQAEYDDYRKLRDFTLETEAPVFAPPRPESMS
jgi:Trk K+ transport system NAD-binding subunit